MKEKVNYFLKTPFPIYLFLLSTFVVLYRAVQAYYFVGISEIFISVLALSLSASLLYFLARMLFKNSQKAGLFILVFLLVSLFYSTIHFVFIQLKVPSPFNRHRYIAAFIGFFLVITFLLLRRIKRIPVSLPAYFNLLFLVLSLYQLTIFTIRKGSAENNLPKTSVYTSFAQQADRVNTGDLPNIYFFIFDEYGGNDCLKEYHGFDNSRIVQFLDTKGFYFASQARSCYNLTEVAMSSLFEMDYQYKWDEILGNDLLGVSRYLHNIRDAQFFRVLQNHQYRIYNCSFFDIADQKQLVHFESFPDAGEFYKFILRNSILITFVNYQKNAAYGKSNLLIRERVGQIIADTPGRRFVYAHFMLPHFDYFFDSTGKYYPDGKGRYPGDSSKNYVEQVKFTNSLITQFVNSIQDNDKNAVIIFQGDHGNRVRKQINDSLKYYGYQPFFAIYFPDKDYQSIHPRFFTVNTLRIISNKYFGYHFPLLEEKQNFFLPASPGSSK